MSGMREQLLQRVEALKNEFQTGQQMLRELETQQSLCRERLLRISGAIQVLEELLAPKSSAASAGSDPFGRDDGGQLVNQRAGAEHVLAPAAGSPRDDRVS
jgi:hypothetical protein